MTIRIKILLSACALAALALSGAAACKDDCNKAAAHIIECAEAYCADNEDPGCERLPAAADEAAGARCAEGDSEEAAAILAEDCSQTLARVGLGGAAEGTDGADEGSEETTEEGSEETTEEGGE